MGKMTRNLLASLLLSLYSITMLAQSEDCEQTLSRAESEFNAGHFYSIPALLQKCLAAGLSREQSIRAYVLLCQVYLINDDPIAADDSYLKLLKADPEYETDEKRDPIDIVYLSKKFTATPIFTPHFRLGINSSIYRQIYSVTTEPYPVSSQNIIRVNVQLGAGVDWNINDNLSFCGELDFASRAFRRKVTQIAGENEQNLLSTQLWMDVPFYLKYAASTGRIRPFGYAGIAFNFLVSSKNTITYTDIKPVGSQLVAEGPSEDVIFQRNRFNRSWVIGGGIKYKIGKDFLYADLRYMGGLSNIVNETKLYYQNPVANQNPNPIGNPNYYISPDVTKYVYVSDLFRLDNISLSFGYIHPIYNPRKVKKARTKSLSRKIRREEGGTPK